MRSAPPRNSVLVSTIANGTADPDFDGTLREAVTVYLGQSPYLEPGLRRARAEHAAADGTDPSVRLTHDVGADVCERLGLQAMLEGSVSAVGRSTLISLIATDCRTRNTILRRQVEVERKEDVLGALGRLTAEMRSSLGESGASLASHNVPIEDATTPSLEALKAYTEAAARRAAGAEMDAIPLLERAIQVDPQFALAYTTLSTVYGGLGETGRSEEFARLAYEHRDRVSERERLYIAYQYHDRYTGNQLKTREALEVWKRTYPGDYRPANALAVLLNRLGDYPGAVLEAEEAARRNPVHAFPYSNLAYAHRGEGRYAEARRVAEQAISRNLETVPMRRLLYQVAEIEGDEAAVRRHIEWASTRSRGFDITGARAQVAAFRGRLTEARQLYAETVCSGQTPGVRTGCDRLRGAGRDHGSAVRIQARRDRARAWPGADCDGVRAAAEGGRRARTRGRTRRGRKHRAPPPHGARGGHAAAPRLPAAGRSRRAAGEGVLRRGRRGAPAVRSVRDRFRRRTRSEFSSCAKRG